MVSKPSLWGSWLSPHEVWCKSLPNPPTVSDNSKAKRKNHTMDDSAFLCISLWRCRDFIKLKENPWSSCHHRIIIVLKALASLLPTEIAGKYPSRSCFKPHGRSKQPQPIPLNRSDLRHGARQRSPLGRVENQPEWGIVGIWILYSSPFNMDSMGRGVSIPESV